MSVADMAAGQARGLRVSLQTSCRFYFDGILLASGIFVQTFVNIFTGDANAPDLSDSTSGAFKCALFTTMPTAIQLQTATTYNAFGTEHAATGNYTTGGIVVPNSGPAPTFTNSDNNVYWDIADVAFTGTGASDLTVSGVNGCVIYQDSKTGDPPVVAIDFATPQSVTIGRLTVSWAVPGATGGVFYVDLAV